MGQSSGRGELRSALEGLLRACAELDQYSSEAARGARNEAHAVANELARLDLPGMSGLADEIAAIGAQMDTGLTTNLAEARRPYLEEAHQLLDLLAPFHGVTDPLPPLTSIRVTTPGAEAIVGHFPPGFARNYVADILGSVHNSIIQNAADADAVANIPAGDAANSTSSIEDGLSGPHQQEGVAMLADPECHAVERHGPHISDEALLARLIWRKDFTGEYAWRVESGGAVTSDHNVGIASARFTSPEAMAKPIDAFLRHAHERHGTWNEFLNKNTKDKTKRVIIHVSAELAGLESGDTFGYRGAATGSRELRNDWLAARQYAMENSGNAVFVIPHNPIEVGEDPGASLIFKRMEDGWRLVTCVPVDEQHPDSKRLESLT